MKLRVICLSVFGVIFLSLVLLMNGVCLTIDAAKGDELLQIEGLDPTDMTEYSSMGEYYPPDSVDTVNVNWVGGRVEIIGYDDDEYFVEEAATRQLMENERLSYNLDGSTFSVFYVADSETYIDDAFKKLEIRVPNNLKDGLKSLNINTNGEVVLTNIKADTISVNNIDSEVRLKSAYAKSTVINTEDGNVSFLMDADVGYSVGFKSRRGQLHSYIDNGKNEYTCGNGEYAYSVKTKGGSLNIDVISDI